MKRILIVEDEVIIAIDLKNKLTQLGYEVLDVVYNSDILTDKLISLNPDLILLDINILGTRNGIEMAHIINENHKIPFVYVTSYTDKHTLEEVKKTNPLGYIVKPFTLEDIRVELELSIYRLKNNSSNSFPTIERINEVYKISAREYEIISDLKSGHKIDQIAKQRFISENTVKTHIKRIYSKCSVHNKLELINKLMVL